MFPPDAACSCRENKLLSPTIEPARARATKTFTRAASSTSGRAKNQIPISCQAVTLRQIAISRTLFEEYAAWLGIDLSFQGFAAEPAGLPGPYVPPRGRRLLALAGSEAAGCVALRPPGEEVCEMKRLFVRSGFRGQGFGKRLAEQIVEEARAIGYMTMRLDALPSMQTAIRLYEALGFAQCAAYYQTSLPETIFMELKL
jgi:ribosomal protein S18 acetylase RimI-like enzyme